MERLLEVQDPASLLASTAGEVLANLPIERGLQSVLDRDRAPGHEKQIRKFLGDGDAVEGIHELRHLHGVHVGVARVVDGDLRNLLLECRLHQSRMVQAHGLGREERKEVEEAAAIPAVVDIAALASLEVEHQVHAVHQHVLLQRAVHVGGIHRGQHLLTSSYTGGSMVPRGKLKIIAKERDKGRAARRALGGALPIDGEEQKVVLLGHRESYFTIIATLFESRAPDRSVFPQVAWSIAICSAERAGERKSS